MHGVLGNKSNINQNLISNGDFKVWKNGLPESVVHINSGGVITKESDSNFSKSGTHIKLSGTSSHYDYFYLKDRNIIKYSNNRVTASFNAKSASSLPLARFRVYVHTGIAGFYVFVSSSNLTLTPDKKRFQFSFNFPDLSSYAINESSSNIGVRAMFYGSQGGGDTFDLEISDFKLEIGDSPSEIVGSSIVDNLLQMLGSKHNFSSSGYAVIPLFDYFGEKKDFIVQWGKKGGSTGVNSVETFTFPVAFPNACIFANAVRNNNAGANDSLNGYGFPSQTQAQFIMGGSGAADLSYIAIGY